MRRGLPHFNYIEVITSTNDVRILLIAPHVEFGEDYRISKMENVLQVLAVHYVRYFTCVLFQL